MERTGVTAEGSADYFLLRSALVSFFLLAVAFGLLLSAVSVAVRLGVVAFCVLVVAVALEELLGLTPFVLFAGRVKQGGYDKDCGGNTGLHVGTVTLARSTDRARRRFRSPKWQDSGLLPQHPHQGQGT
jgi:hypothetical protein